MNYYDSLLNKVQSLTEGLPCKSYSYNSDNVCEDIGYCQVILQRDMAFELDGAGFNLFTSSDIDDEIILIGDDLNGISDSRKFARISIVQLEVTDGEQQVYKAVKKADYVKYHYFPMGYMIRTTSRTHKESVRVSKSAVKSGISFEKVGNLMIKKYKEHPGIKGVKLIFITDPVIDYRQIDSIAQKSSAVTETLNHVMNSVTFDCDSCNLKSVCDEVEGLKQLHFKNAKSGM